MTLSDIQPLHVLVAIVVAFPFFVRFVTWVSDRGEQWIQRSKYNDRFKHLP